MADQRTHEIFNLNNVFTQFPPDPESKARHRAEILVKSETLRIVAVTALEGGVMHEHSAPGPISVHVTEGEFCLTIDGEPRNVKEGEVAVIAPRVRHAVECMRDGSFLLTIAHLSHVPDDGKDD